MGDKQRRASSQRVVQIGGTVIVCVLILAAAAAGIVMINRTEPTAQRTGATRKTAALVQTVEVKRGSYRPRIGVLGHVEPARDIRLNPRVSGWINSVDPTFVPGGVVDRGQLLLTIDPSDFRNALAMRESELRQARADLAIERGRQTVAKQEFEQLGETIDPANRALVLREPQIESIRARVDAAQAAVDQAKLELDRTRISAPFDAKILHRAVNVGSQVATGDELARLVGINEYWVIATVPQRDVRWLRFPLDDGEGSRAVLRNPDGWGSGARREGRVARMIGQVDQQTRLVRVLITVADPLARQRDAPPLVLGSLLETEIEGRSIDAVVRLDRDYIRQNQTVWVMADGKLQIRDVRIVFRDAEYAYIREGLEDGDQVVTTSLSTVAEGIALRRSDAGSKATGGGP